MSPEQKSLLSAQMHELNSAENSEIKANAFTGKKSGDNSNMDMMLNDFNNQSQSYQDGDQPVGMDEIGIEIDGEQIDYNNLNESQLLALQA